MHKLSFLVVLLFMGLSAIVYGQQESSKYNLAVSAYETGKFPEAEQLWGELAAEGNANAQYALGIMHLKKEARVSADATAFQYLVEAAKQQHVASMFNLGVAYWEGRGVSRQTEKAANWWEAAAEKNDPGAQYNLGLAYYIGEGRTQSTGAALHWIQLAADNGHPQAQALLPGLQDETQAKANRSGGETDEPHAGQTIARPVEPVLKKPVDETPALDAQPASRIDPVVLRAAPDDNSMQVYVLKAGASIEKLKSLKNWTQVLVAEPYPVWVHESLINELGNGAGTIKGDYVNMRPAASTDNARSPALGQLNNGESVSIILKRSPWIQIMPPRAFPAWMKTEDTQ